MVDQKILLQQISFTKNKERHNAREVIRQAERAVQLEKERLQAEADAAAQREADERMRRHRQLEQLKKQQQARQDKMSRGDTFNRRHSGHHHNVPLYNDNNNIILSPPTISNGANNIQICGPNTIHIKTRSLERIVKERWMKMIISR